MNAITPGIVFSRVGREPGSIALIRIVKTFPDDDRVIFIEIPSGPRKKAGKKQANYYARGFKWMELSNFLLQIDRKEFLQTEFTLPKWWYMTDDEIRKKYPPRGDEEDSSMLVRREFKLKLIQPLLELAESADFEALRSLGKLAATHAVQRNVSLGQVLTALHRYFAFGSFPNALLPNNPLKGAPGKERIATKAKPGRKNAAAKAGNTALEGKILTREDRANLVDGWAMYVRPGTSTSEAFLAMSGTFYNKGYSLKNGLLVPDLLDAHLRPTKENFLYHGPKDSDKLGASRRLMGEGEWALDYRPLSGSARDGIVGFGHVGSLDASPIDVNLNAVFSRSCPIGVGRGMFVRDGWLGIYCGLHVAIGGLGTDDANLAILNAATDKAELLKRYGLNDLDPAGIPSIFFTRYLSDNGELRSLKGIDSNVKGLGATIEFVESHRADRNSISESGHHSRHRRLDHHLEGTTRGRQTKRGETMPIKNALLTRFEYMRLLLLWIYWANTQQEVRHLQTVEMKRANVEPTRIAIYNWAKKEGLVRSKPLDPLFIQAKLLPSFTASIQRNGIVLHRPKTGNAVELLPQANFFGEYLATSGMIRSAMNGGPKYVTVKAHPEDLSKVLLIDQHGIHVLKNTSLDPILMHEGSISDLCAFRDTQRRERVEAASHLDQDLSEQRAYRDAVQSQAKQERKKEREAKKTKRSAKTDRTQVRANQAEEARHNLEQAAMRGAIHQDRTAKFEPASPSVEKTPESLPVSGQPMAEAFNVVSISRADIYQKRLARFHSERKKP